METFVAVVHILVAFFLIGLVLIQDTKSGSVGGAFGGGGSNSVLGATGATTLAQQMTRWTAVIFAITCLSLSIFSNRASTSVLDSAPVVTGPASAPQQQPGTEVAPAADAAPKAAEPTTPPAQ